MSVTINELQVSTTGADWEFIELFGIPGTSLDGYSLLVIEADVGSSTGRIDRVIDFSGNTIGADGLFLATSPDAEAAYGVTGDGSILNNSFENSSATYLLVEGFTGAVGDDLDTNDDGILDAQPWTTLHDQVSLLDSATDFSYANTSLGPDGPFLPSGIFRETDGGAWSTSYLNFSEPDGTPGVSNGAEAGPVVITQTGGATEVSEDGATDSFDVVLNIQPASDVSITISADGETTVDLTELTFTPDNWDQAQTVTVSAVDDIVNEMPDDHSSELTFAVASADPTYDALAVDPLFVSVEDNEITITLISEIQGDGDASALVGQEVFVEGVVTALLSNSGGVFGFYLQEEDADADADVATSEGIFVVSFGTTVSVGDQVLVSGEVDEFRGLTELTDVTSITTLASGVALPSLTQITLADADNYEAYEGMRVELVSGSDDPLTVITNFNLGRFGEVMVSEGNQIQPTQIYDPETQQTEIQELTEENFANRITIDDGSTAQNPDELRLIDSGDGTPLVAGDPITEDGPTLRLGAEVTSITGVMDERFGSYRIQSDGPLDTVPGTNEDARPADAPEVGGELKVASFNVLNYFSTIDVSGAGTGPDGTLNPRGADTESELVRQTDKIVAALAELDADVIGLQELENNGFGTDSAIATLVDALNAFLGADIYAFVNPGVDFVGEDAITTGIIYKKDAVTVTGSAVLVFEEPSADATIAAAEALYPYVSASSQIDDVARNRPAVVATFVDEDGSEFTVAVNHFKSKGSSGLERLVDNALSSGAPQELIDALLADPNVDQNDGQGYWNQVRTDAALELASWLESNPTGAESTDNLLILGDLNAYAMEDPVSALIENGYTDLAASFIGMDAYSFVFDGMRGTLDYGLASDGLLDNVAGVAEWHINADEPNVLNYDESFNNPAFYNDDVFAASDHDPLIIGLTLDDPTVMVRLDFGSAENFKRAVVYSEDGDVQSVMNLARKKPEVDLSSAGITIDADDNNPNSDDFVAANRSGLGVFSELGDQANRKAKIDEGETIIFSLADTDALGDALAVEFEFNDVDGTGKVELNFFDDDVLVETAILNASEGEVAHDLSLNTSFDAVSLTVLDDTSLELLSSSFARTMIEEDVFAF